MHAIVVGCGIAGLACSIGFRKHGHDVTILERAPQVAAFGAGINISPNASRALRSLGVLDKVLQHVYFPEHASLRSYKTNELLSRQKMGKYMRDLYEAPFAVIHRYDLYRVLYEEACAAGVKVLFSHPVIALNSAMSSITVANGLTFSADLIVGADGERSVCREAVVGRTIKPKDSGVHVFRFMMPRSRIAAIPHLTYLIDPPCINLMVGPGGPSMCYCVRYDDLFNVVLALQHEALEDPPMLPHEVPLATVKEEFEGWPLIQELVGLSDRCIRWTSLVDSETLERWTSKKVVLIGDACHIMTPWIGQGASMAIEDAVVLSTLLGTLPIEQPGLLERALGEFQRIRYDRVNFLQRKAVTLYEQYALSDGKAQQERDQRLKSENMLMEASHAGELKDGLSNDFAHNSLNFLTDVTFRNWVFGYNAEAVGKEARSNLSSIHDKDAKL